MQDGRRYGKLYAVSPRFMGELERLGAFIGYYKHTIYYPYGLFVFVFIKVDKLQPEDQFWKKISKISHANF